jgi:hypothetical protein
VTARVFAAGDGDGEVPGVRLGLLDGFGLAEGDDETDAEAEGDGELLTEAEGVSDGGTLTDSVDGSAAGSDSPAACRAALGWTSSGLPESPDPPATTAIQATRARSTAAAEPRTSRARMNWREACFANGWFSSRRQ